MAQLLYLCFGFDHVFIHFHFDRVFICDLRMFTVWATLGTVNLMAEKEREGEREREREREFL